MGLGWFLGSRYRVIPAWGFWRSWPRSANLLWAQEHQLFLKPRLLSVGLGPFQDEGQAASHGGSTLAWSAAGGGAAVLSGALGSSYPALPSASASTGTARPTMASPSCSMPWIMPTTRCLASTRWWLSYLLLFILDLIICLLACLGLAKRSRCLLTAMLCCGLMTLVLSWASMAVDTSAAVGTSDFCVAPDQFIMNQTQSELSAEVVHYYLYCSQSLSNPFQQTLTIYQRSLTTMQIQVQGLLQFAVPIFPTAKKELLGIQQLLNSSETSLHQLTAMLDCRGLHKDYLDALMGICYDGIEGLLYLALFSLLAAMSFSTIICATPRAWKHFTSRDRDYDDIDEEDPFNPQARRIATHHPARGQLRSFCSYSSSLGSQTSLHPPAQTISNAPVSEYMNQAALFGGNPRYENVPLIGRGSPPPTYSPSMRATYLSVNDDHARRYTPEFPA
uniref:Protein tweety homolog n=1 Tax=Crocodylus porosus TaxID=8502 RepID=A0A7M4FLR2_CROPO